MAGIRRFTRRHGWITLLVVLLLVGLVEALRLPWAFHIGGKFTPTTSWTGVGAATAPNGQRYALKVYLYGEFGRGACSLNGCDDYEGTVAVCTSTGTYTFDNMDGTIDGWASTEGHHMVMDVRERKAGPTRDLQMTLRGTWHGPALTVSDGGYLTRDFPGGRPATEFGPAQPTDAATFTLKPGDFTALCDSVRR